MELKSPKEYLFSCHSQSSFSYKIWGRHEQETGEVEQRRRSSSEILVDVEKQSHTDEQRRDKVETGESLGEIQQLANLRISSVSNF